MAEETKAGLEPQRSDGVESKPISRGLLYRIARNLGRAARGIRTGSGRIWRSAGVPITHAVKKKRSLDSEKEELTETPATASTSEDRRKSSNRSKENQKEKAADQVSGGEEEPESQKQEADSTAKHVADEIEAAVQTSQEQSESEEGETT
jgi:phage protein D